MAFYQCLQCKKRWEYPISECPYCFVALEKMESKTCRVNSVIKVAIPTLFHPNVPYYILLLEDEMANFWGYKSEKEYQAGDEFKLQPDQNAVAIWRVKYDVIEAVGKALELMGDINVGKDSKVVILPTLAKPSHAYFRDNASPEFLSAVLQILLGRGVEAKNITVAGQSFDDLPVVAVAQKSGLIDAGAKFGVAALDLATGEFERMGNFEISKTILSADLVINLAMEKIGAANATNNLFRVLKKENYLGQKYLSSDAEIVAALEPILDKMIVIGEAENVQRSNKLTSFMGLVLAGRSSRNIDRVFNEIAQSFKVPETIKDIPVQDIAIAGRTIKEVQYCAEIF
ncbi:MAG: hypothetical protein WCX69_04135 [Candidatus Paceibacterota bacterium]